MFQPLRMRTLMVCSISMEESFVSRVEKFFDICDAIDRDIAFESSTLSSYRDQLDSVTAEQGLLERSRAALGDVRQLLTKSSLEYCESLATSAVQSIFNVPYTVRYSETDQRFVLDTGDNTVDLSSDEGGGMVTVISFVFNLYLIMKQKARRVMLFDEAWTQVSAGYFPAFIDFVHRVCHDLGFDLLLITHDERIAPSMVDHVYQINDEGNAVKIK